MSQHCVDMRTESNLPFVVSRCAAVLFTLLAVRAAALTSPLEWEWTRQVETQVLSRFVQHGVERADESFQVAGWLKSESLKLGTWTNFPISDTRSHEFALVGAYVHRLEGGTELEFDVTHYHLRDARNGHPGHTAELTFLVSHPVGPGRVVASVLFDVNRHAEQGELAYAGEWALKSLGTFLNYRVYAGHKHGHDVLHNLPGDEVVDSYRYHGVDLTIPYRIGGATVVTLGVHYAGTVGQRPFWSPINAPVRDKVWAILATSYEF